MDYTLGSHPARSIDAALGMTNGGQYQVAVECEFTEGPNLGKRITWYGYFTDKTKERTFESLRTLGMRGSDLSDLSDLRRSDTPTVQLVLDTEEYQGKQQVKVKWVNRLGGLAMKNKLEESDAKKFAAMMRAEFAAFDKSSGGTVTQKQTPPKSKPNGKPVDDADIPF